MKRRTAVTSCVLLVRTSLPAIRQITSRICSFRTLPAVSLSCSAYRFQQSRAAVGYWTTSSGRSIDTRNPPCSQSIGPRTRSRSHRTLRPPKCAATQAPSLCSAAHVRLNHHNTAGRQHSGIPSHEPPEESINASQQAPEHGWLTFTQMSCYQMFAAAGRDSFALVISTRSVKIGVTSVSFHPLSESAAKFCAAPSPSPPPATSTPTTLQHHDSLESSCVSAAHDPRDGADEMMSNLAQLRRR